MPIIFRAKAHYGSPLFGYVLSFTLVAITGIVRLALGGPDGALFPFLYFYPAIAIASFLGGAGPGLAAVLLGGGFASTLFPDPPAPPAWLALAIVGPLLSTGFAHLRYIRDRNRTIARELARFKFIGDHASDWILLLNDAGKILYVNHTACAALGWTDIELTGRAIETLVPEAQRPALLDVLDKTRSGTARPVELIFQRKDESLALLELGCTAVRTDEDRVIYAAARDISERKQIEKKLLDIRHWESLGALAGGLAHDFNNLLTSILGNASLAKDILPPRHEIAPMLEAIISATERSSELVRMLLATAGHRSRYSELLRLDHLLEATLANQTLPPNVRVAREAEATPFVGDRRSFETLFSNLISNAAEAYGKQEGEVRIAIGLGPAPAVRGASFEEGDPGSGQCLGIVVEDCGSGMSPEILVRAFDPFFSTRFTGRGLGLAAVRGIVRSYSGKLLLETAPGRGTRVEVWLPVSRDA